jgi:C_GCAxxG_C_C family probable redox protein
MSTKSELAVDIFNSGFNCAQAVFSSHSADYGLDTSFAKKIGGAFIGGIANNGEVCGAVVGALMLIGLKYGKYKEDNNVSKEITIKITNNYIQKFKKEFGSIICRDLLKYDISVEKEAQKARESCIFKTLCPVLVKRSVELVEEELEK